MNGVVEQLRFVLGCLANNRRNGYSGKANFRLGAVSSMVKQFAQCTIRLSLLLSPYWNLHGICSVSLVGKRSFFSCSFRLVSLLLFVASIPSPTYNQRPYLTAFLAVCCFAPLTTSCHYD
jgi:hypothetical protein